MDTILNVLGKWSGFSAALAFLQKIQPEVMAVAQIAAGVAGLLPGLAVVHGLGDLLALLKSANGALILSGVHSFAQAVKGPAQQPPASTPDAPAAKP